LPGESRLFMSALCCMPLVPRDGDERKGVERKGVDRDGVAP
jgi:hypothetical protein